MYITSLRLNIPPNFPLFASKGYIIPHSPASSLLQLDIEWNGYAKIISKIIFTLINAEHINLGYAYEINDFCVHSTLFDTIVTNSGCSSLKVFKVIDSKIYPYFLSLRDFIDLIIRTLEQEELLTRYNGREEYYEHKCDVMAKVADILCVIAARNKPEIMDTKRIITLFNSDYTMKAVIIPEFDNKLKDGIRKFNVNVEGINKLTIEYSTTSMIFNLDFLGIGNFITPNLVFSEKFKSFFIYGNISQNTELRMVKDVLDLYASFVESGDMRNIGNLLFIENLAKHFKEHKLDLVEV